jgi:hypothetical protein
VLLISHAKERRAIRDFKGMPGTRSPANACSFLAIIC